MTYREFKKNLENSYCIHCVAQALETDIDGRKVKYGSRCICSCCGEEHHKVLGLPLDTVIWCTVNGKFDQAAKFLNKINNQ